MTENILTIEEDRVVMLEQLAHAVIYGSLGENAETKEDEDAENEFSHHFDIVQSMQELFLADPTDDFYQGIKVMCVIKRKSDNRLFGFEYFTPIADDSEAYIEANGDEHGFDFEVPDDFDWDIDNVPQWYVFSPVKPFTLIGYQYE